MKTRKLEADLQLAQHELAQARAQELDARTARTALEEVVKVHSTNMETLQKHNQSLYASNVNLQEDKAKFLKANQEAQDAKRTLQNESGVARTEHARKLREAQEELQAARTEHARKLREAQDQLQALRTESSRKTQDEQANAALQKQLTAAQKDLATARSEHETRMRELRNEVDRHEQQVAKNKTVSNDLAQNVASLREEVRKHEEVRARAQEERTAWTQEKARLQDENKRQQEGITQLLLEHEKKVVEIEELRARVRAQEVQLEKEKEKEGGRGRGRGRASPLLPSSDFRIHPNVTSIKGENEFLTFL